MRGGEISNLALSLVPTRDLPQATKEAIVALCSRAFAQDFGNLFDFVTDSMHILAQRDGALVSHACWAMRHVEPEGVGPLRTAYVDAVATEPTLHGQGIGSAVITRLNAEIQGYALGGLSTPRVSFYERLGWERWHGPTAVRAATGLIPTPDDTVMIFRTPLTPPLDKTSLLIADWRNGQPW
jgi:aminoglycoside 2'-N-acetyltransferase I